MNRDIMINLGFGKEAMMAEEGICPTCGKPVNVKAFRDELSKREFKISGMCQECQDDFFGEDYEEPTFIERG